MKITSSVGSDKKPQEAKPMLNLNDLNGSNRSKRFWLAVAGILGATAIGLAAYGAHGLPKDFPAKRRHIFDVSNRFHLILSLALMAVPITRHPNITGALFLFGMTVFCGCCYTHSLTGYEGIVKYTPVGGWTLVVAWLSLCL